MVAIGTTPVTIVATDAWGNSSSCPTSVVVKVGGEMVSASVSAGQTVTTDTENDGATAADPLETTVTVGAAGTVTIEEKPADSSPGEFSLLGHVVHITAPADPANLEPGRTAFKLDPSIIPAGATANTIEVFKDGQIVPQCTGPNQPTCVTIRMTLDDGDAFIEVRTTSFGQWSFGVPAAPITAASIAERVNTLPLNEGQKNSLIVKLDHGQFAAFINEMQALQHSGQLDRPTADGLIARAQAIVRAN
jgi:hypothetical protein